MNSRFVLVLKGSNLKSQIKTTESIFPVSDFNYPKEGLNWFENEKAKKMLVLVVPSLLVMERLKV